ncbi:MAG: Hpt domain-containing protein [Candidatus Magnetomorum sp.]|nr:Hpt domain-containing protein [Candidatus Magnetomorum sp.]
MPVGSHKDAFKAHQLVKKLSGKNEKKPLVEAAANILLDFVKNQRQVNANHMIDTLPEDNTSYDQKKLDKALIAVDKLCGKCDESHDDACFVNQTRRMLIKAKTGVDLGPSFDGNKSLAELLKEAETIESSSDPSEKQAACETIQEVQNETIDELREAYDALEKKYEDLSEKDIFRSTLIDEIVGTIAAVSEGNFAAEMPVHDDGQLGKLATAFNVMLQTINETMQNLDKLVSERSAELRMIMNTVPVGLMSIITISNEDYRINPEYSKTCEKILGVTELRGRNYLDAIGLTKRTGAARNDMAKFLDLLTQQLLPEEDMAGLNPCDELEIKNDDGISTWAKINYHLIHKGEEKKPDILVVLEDITRAKAMQEAIAQSERENTQLKAIAEDPDLFCEFLTETKKMLDQVVENSHQLASASDPKPLVNDMFRGVHTIKGTAASFGLGAISQLAAELENSLDDLRQADQIDTQTIDDTQKALEELNRETDEMVEKTEQLLGQKIGGGDTVIRVSANDIKSLIERVSSMPIPTNERESIVGTLQSFRNVSVKKGLGQALKIIPGLIERLDKEVVFELIDNNVGLDCDLSRELNTPFVHLIRNAFDHGIEYSEDRVANGKSEQGRVVLTVKEDTHHLTLILSDDGKGLDPEQLKISAIGKGLITEEEAANMQDIDAQRLIFKPGFSTAEVVSDVSGRGVGMDAVVHTIESILAGQVAIESTLGKGTTFIIQIPKNQMIETQSDNALSKQAFGYCKGCFYEFTPDGLGGYTAKPVDVNAVPNQLLKKWKTRDFISSEKYPDI